ncbi:MAG: DUF3761 domain-containing protein [Terriglobia bacterium]
MSPGPGLSTKSSSSTGHSKKSTATTGTKKSSHPSKKGHVLSTDSSAPKGAKARCGDGTYSSASGRGACSHHRGVDAWLAGQPAEDQQKKQ